MIDSAEETLKANSYQEQQTNQIHLDLQKFCKFVFFHAGLHIARGCSALEDAPSIQETYVAHVVFVGCVTALQEHSCLSHTEPQYRWTCHSHSQTCWKCFLKVGTSLHLPQESHPKPDGCRHHASKPAELSLAAPKVVMVHHHRFRHPPSFNQPLVTFQYFHIPLRCM